MRGKPFLQRVKLNNTRARMLHEYSLCHMKQIFL